MPRPHSAVLMALQFWPRGGAAQVVRYLAPEIVEAGWPVSLVTGSLGDPGDHGYAPEFFAPLPVTAVDYTPAMQAWCGGGDPFSLPVPLHPSFEDREGAPDRVFASVDDEDFERQVEAWSGALIEGGLEVATVAHLHHLTPVNEAVHRLRPDLPVVVSLHGTEMAMLEAILGRDADGEGDGDGDGDGDSASANAAPWPHAEVWAQRLRAWASQAHRLVVASPTDWARALELFDVPEDRLLIVAPGVDQERFRPFVRSLAGRTELLREWLVDDPRGWDESGVIGSVRYEPHELSVFTDPEQPVLISVGRFTEPKRLPLLLRAYGRARREHGVTAPLLVWGGFPGEWEGEHPVSVVRDDGIEGVFFTGWHGHDELTSGLACADVFVAPSVGEAFGQVFIEAMACGLPVVAAASGGPLAFVNDVPGSPNGWLVPPDDEEALAAALAEATMGPEAAVRRAIRADNALQQVRARFSWTAAAGQVVEGYEQASAAAAGATRAGETRTPSRAVV